ncbi:restriction endonuclease subunit S [Pseudonocardia alni]|jgi:type I restriction enzyme S subunit|uniref:Type I restriction enzyme S subunit n=1 Tax=Pseudonocardia alni TaxID=33907 RepID=A0AA44ZNU0_PSEA5|nr:restriction endonuclease subunit S [Pseudonocardia alni]PKB30202.1 type I restriction enzyme S subunit [Pseudonocardia alni]
MKLIKLGDVTTKIGSGATPRGGANVYQPEGTAFIRSQNVLDNRMRLDELARIDDQAASALRGVTVEAGDVLLNITGDSIARCCLIEERVLPARVSQHVAIIRTTTAMDSRYLQRVLVNPPMKNYLLATSDGGTRNALTKAMISTLEVPCPPIAEQRAIAEVLGALDDKIVANECAVGIGEKLVRALFDRAARNGSRERIDKVASLITRGVTPKYVESDGMTVLNQKCVRGQRVELSPARMMMPLESRRERILRRNDVLVNSTGFGTLGRAARWTRSDLEVTVDSHITIVRFDDKLTEPACAGVGLLELQSQIEALAEGSTGQTELRRDLLGALELRLAPPAMQAELGRQLRQFDDLALALRTENDRLAATRDELLPPLMSGKIRVSDAEKTVEAVV